MFKKMCNNGMVFVMMTLFLACQGCAMPMFGSSPQPIVLSSAQPQPADTQMSLEVIRGEVFGEVNGAFTQLNLNDVNLLQELSNTAKIGERVVIGYPKPEQQSAIKMRMEAAGFALQGSKRASKQTLLVNGKSRKATLYVDTYVRTATMVPQLTHLGYTKDPQAYMPAHQPVPQYAVNGQWQMQPQQGANMVILPDGRQARIGEIVTYNGVYYRVERNGNQTQLLPMPNQGRSERQWYQNPIVTMIGGAAAGAGISALINAAIN